MVMPRQVLFIGDGPQEAEPAGTETEPGGGEAQSAAARVERKTIEGDEPEVREVHTGCFAAGDCPQQTIEESHQSERRGQQHPELLTGPERSAHQLHHYDHHAEADENHGGIDRGGNKAMSAGSHWLIAEDLRIHVGLEFARLRWRRGNEVERGLFHRRSARRTLLCRLWFRNLLALHSRRRRRQRHGRLFAPLIELNYLRRLTCKERALSRRCRRVIRGN